MSAHPGEGALLRFIDGNARAEERARLSRHVRRCRVCARRTDELRDFRLVALEALESRRPRAPMRNSARMAAGLALVLALAGAATPVRAWLAEGWRTVEAWALGAETTPPVLPEVPGAGSSPLREDPDPGSGERVAAPDGAEPGRRPTGSASLAFLPQAERFVVDVERRQVAGKLHVQFGGGDAFVEWQYAAPLRNLRVKPGHLTVDSDPSSRGWYVVQMPWSVREVIVRIEGRQVGRLLVRPGEPYPERSFDLSREP